MNQALEQFTLNCCTVSLMTWVAFKVVGAMSGSLTEQARKKFIMPLSGCMPVHAGWLFLKHFVYGIVKRSRAAARVKGISSLHTSGRNRGEKESLTLNCHRVQHNSPNLEEY